MEAHDVDVGTIVVGVKDGEEGVLGDVNSLCILSQRNWFHCHNLENDRGHFKSRWKFNVELLIELVLEI